MPELEHIEFYGADDYNLCALYCDYHEWLNGPNPPARPETRLKYEAKLAAILRLLAHRHKED